MVAGKIVEVTTVEATVAIADQEEAGGDTPEDFLALERQDIIQAVTIPARAAGAQGSELIPLLAAADPTATTATTAARIKES